MRPSARWPWSVGVALGVLLVVGSPCAAQSGAPEQDPEGWNSPRALELVERARALRQRRSVDSTLRAYAAHARGHVYFLIDRPGDPERTLVKADQIALEVYWKAPDLTKQRIVGTRDRKVLPTSINYHLDHLTVVQDEFDDRIHLGDGDEVSAVVHPVAPGAESMYDFRLADSLTISFGGTRPDVRVYELLVRPQDVDVPGFVGSVFLDRATAAIVRMSFTFTPASYVDPYLDYIRISLDNSLWEGRHWLPYRQEAELRRELPQLDFLAGSIIRGRFEIGGYVFNPDLPPGLFAGPAVTAVPEAQRRAFPFEDPLLPEDETESFAPPPTLEDVRAAARKAVGRRVLSGLGGFRLHARSASDIIRYDRAEGLFVGLGVGWRSDAGVRVTARGGWSFGRDEPSVALGVEGETVLPGTGARLVVNELRDLGPFPGASRTVNTFTALVAHDDYLDPWFVHGAELHHARPMGGARVRFAARAERHEAATNVVDGTVEDPSPDFRAVRPVEEGDLLVVETAVALTPADDLRLDATATLGRFRLDRPFQARSPGDARGWAAMVGGATWSRATAARPLDLRASLHGGAVSPGAPPQALFLLGGRETLLGHPYRGLVGDRFWLARASAEHPVNVPWLTLRLHAAAGQAMVSAHPLDAADWAADPDAGARASVGAGIGLAWDILQVDVGRGLGGGGGWGTAVSVSRRFSGWL